MSNYNKFSASLVTALATLLAHFGWLPGGETVDSFVSTFAPPLGALLVWLVPNRPSAGSRLGVVGFVAVLLLLGCAGTSLRTNVARAEGAWVETLEAYQSFLEFDNAQVEACYARHPDLRGEEAREACPPLMPQSERDVALQVVHEARSQFGSLDDVDLENASAAELVAEVLGRIDALTFRLLLLTEGDPR